VSEEGQFGATDQPVLLVVLNFKAIVCKVVPRSLAGKIEDFIASCF
jgi:hypothetical protein